MDPSSGTEEKPDNVLQFTEKPKIEEKESFSTEKPKKQSQIGVNRTETVPKQRKMPRKPKGATHKKRMKLKTAILNGEKVNYEKMIEKFGVGKSTISSVLKELSESGLIEKNGRNWVLKRRAG